MTILTLKRRPKKLYWKITVKGFIVYILKAKI
jgi:hypothetical protein